MGRLAEKPEPSARLPSICLCICALTGWFQAFGRCVMMILQSIFVAADLPIQLVHQLINGGIQIFG